MTDREKTIDALIEDARAEEISADASLTEARQQNTALREQVDKLKRDVCQVEEENENLLDEIERLRGLLEVHGDGLV